MFGNELANEGYVAVSDQPVPVVQLRFHAGSVAESLLERKSFMSRAEPYYYYLRWHRQRTLGRRNFSRSRIATHEQHL
jgi:hypothetical protein